MSINTVNPYANNNQVSPLEQDVLWEFAKLNDKVKRASNLARLTAESPNESLLAELRTLEKRMGLVLTLFQASVWAVIVDTQAAEEARAHQQEQEQQQRLLLQQQQEQQYALAQGQAQDISYDDSRRWDDDSVL
ncbi:uncharacterized protein I303_103555 [Kwoniella dejecticola CBS 10117]|uniref:DASH complex subunit DAD3 n=1 Tax=Kwoniella dejecticola CBS 10117 TaxID=1296121 RepID=A0A1A6A735_9TREE|nr:DASH complex subunit DAD3 [Kwoniella dejecticola CBS 10117]OBR85863.1 DASH complex subunit DAD3 [Kwoniella dejecticola CBS 10117]